MENWVEDMIAVIDEVGCERVAVVQLWGAGIGPLFAATHPGRTSALVLVNTTARVRRADDYPEGWADEELEGFVALGGEMFSVEVMAPNLVADTDFRRWYERAVRLGAPPDIRRRRFMAAMNTDTRGVFGFGSAPTLVIGQSGSLLQGQRRYIADHVPDARFVEVSVPGHDTAIYEGRPPWITPSAPCPTGGIRCATRSASAVWMMRTTVSGRSSDDPVAARS